MGKREILDEILEKKYRSEYGGVRGLWELERIEKCVATRPTDQITIALSLVGVIGCVEVVVRDAICRLVDHGSPYADRVAALLKGDGKFTIEVVRAFQDKRVSLGEFVSHLLPLSTLTHVVSHFETLLDSDFRDVLSGVREYVPPRDAVWNLLRDDVEGKPQIQPPPIISDVERLLTTLSRAYTVRHMVVHEATFSVVSAAELREYLHAAKSLAAALVEYVRQTLEPYVPRSVQEQSFAAMIEANRIVDVVTSSFDELARELAALMDSENSDTLERLGSTQAAFEEYLKEEIAFNIALYQPASGNALRNVEAHVTQVLASARRDILKEALDTLNLSAEAARRGCGA